jgi:hypothetical protein
MTTPELAPGSRQEHAFVLTSVCTHYEYEEVCLIT